MSGEPTHNDLFHALPAPIRQALLANAKQIAGEKGELLVRQGDLVDGVFLVLGGALRVFSLHPTGREATLYRVRSQQICLLSLNGVFANMRYPAWVAVESRRATAALLPGAAFRRLFPMEPGVQQLVMHSLTATVAELLTRLDETLLVSLRDRLMSLLRRYADADGCLRMTHHEIATYLGSSREVVSRELAILKRTHHVTTGRGVTRLREAASKKRSAAR